jgi:murein DD-endopeptidase MepM/ murein hydrolase activator NlpD
MVQFVGILFIVFAVVGLALCGAVLTGHASSMVPAGASGIVSGGNESGLSVVNFDLFAKNGKGWDAVTQGYGDTSDSYLYIDHWHNGIDIAADYGAPIYSPVVGGVVLATGDQDDYCPGKGFGKFVVIQDDTDHLDLLFAHLGTIAVSPDASVAKDTELGTIGTSGLETGPHLHFSIFESVGFTVAPAHGCGPYPEGHDIDPVPYLGTVYN